ncbi:Beta-glucosidase/6-phospho-beta- glucosidase/beta-galactosidase [Lactococcus cremoris subsp. cremoris UC509.9]|uniref:Glycoside hydrolase family 1 protein n=1 Tax=Lactococcus lactis subsp. cremoris TaxID=1359 RepID=A0AAJ6N2V7_LACLC|nr:glycoside hydrolase family 1 protein [Lactococcus cremoris]AFW91867.1 Beta-glucosidase/6-phospho-beta- glucosidase/beta-galactosidase [Lactococcus cremoris subsp. cremoris UC509.9]ARD91575.1 glycoside hydrolase family 1 protein [Lactococcus cremoris]MRM68345.1 family 1 glycosylhydrolase [Lactococcus cremoris]QJD20126.1 glycoside hydrolase family 1 protein [Lactococcus cremoris]QRZ30104.1 Beta-glucosidase/6-phospho-beta- glucosidase/beta-galactosidase [Lactococcus cremoris]
MIELKFPKDFWWGAATSGPQLEGRFNKKHANIFDYDFEKFPEHFWHGIGPDVASNFYNDFREDIRLMKKAGLNSVRTSIQWSRLIDDLEEGTVNPEAVEFYNAVIDEFLSNGIRPIINLHHFDLPVELLHKYGGWENKQVISFYVKYAEQCFRLFGDRVSDWFTHNEPMVVVEGGYLYQFHYPDLVDGKLAVQVAYNLQLASSLAIQKYREVNQNSDGKIGIILNLSPNYPASQDKEDIAAAHFADLWQNRLFMDASVKGKFPNELVEILTKDGVLWNSTLEELETIKNNKVDMFGVNFYHPNRAQRPHYSPDSLTVDWLPNKYFDDYKMVGARMNVDKGWEIYPQTLYNIAKNIQKNYGNIPWFVSECGIGVSNEDRYLNRDGLIEDDYRIQFVQEHLYWLHKAIDEGANCYGFHLWTPIDCFSWRNSYRNRYGLISVNIHTQKKCLKKSAYFFKNLAEKSILELSEEIYNKFN